MKSTGWLLVWVAGLMIVEIAGFQMKIKRDQPVQNDAFSSKLSSFHGMAYHGYISVGKPAISHKVKFDTGSDVTWLPMKGCTLNGQANTDFCRKSQNLYDPTRYRSAEATGELFNVSYGIGDVSGEYYLDEFALGYARFGSKNFLKLKEKFKFGVGKDISNLDDGILGLSLPNPKATSAPTIMQALMKEGVLERPIITTHLADCGKQFCADGGMVTFGEIDKENCEPVFSWVPVEGNGMHWRFGVKSVHFKMVDSDTGAVVETHLGVKNADTPANENADGKQTNARKAPIHAMSDTGASVIYAPEEIFDRLVDELDFIYIPSFNSYVVQCDRQLEFTIELMDGQKLNLNPNHLIVQEQSVTMSNSANKKRLVKMCRLNFEPSPWPDWVLGDAFLRPYCQVYDYENRKIGFASAKQAPSKQN